MTTSSSELLSFFAGLVPVAAHKPWPRYQLDRGRWQQLIVYVGQSPVVLLGLWAEPAEVHVALYEEASGQVVVASLPCAEGTFPSFSKVRPGAIRLERTVAEMTGLVPEGASDTRPWLDHGQFPLSRPLAAAPGPAAPRPATEYTFLRVEGEGLHQIPVGPVHAGIIEPGHFRFHCNGEAVARLEERLGYVHKGIEHLLQGKTVAEAAKIAGRVSGDATVAHALAFCRAVEAARGTAVPVRAHALRGLMAELERIANHFGDIGAICNDAAFAIMHGQCNILREKVMQAAEKCFGHRFMMDRVIPGGVSADLSHEGKALLQTLVHDLRAGFAPLLKIYDRTPSLLDRTYATGFVSHELVVRYGAGGYVGRGSARPFDARHMLPYPPYDGLDVRVPIVKRGDVGARLWVRAEEIKISLDLIGTLLAHLPEGPLAVPVSEGAGEGMALVESFRGDVLTWVRLSDDGRVRRCHPRDPSWFQWPLLEASIENNIVADFPLCNKSFNCSYSGHDL